jgi:hypothetical protein
MGITRATPGRGNLLLGLDEAVVIAYEGGRVRYQPLAAADWGAEAVWAAPDDALFRVSR